MLPVDWRLSMFELMGAMARKLRFIAKEECGGDLVVMVS